MHNTRECEAILVDPGLVCSMHFAIYNPMLPWIGFWGRCDKCPEDRIPSSRKLHMNVFSSRHEFMMEGQNRVWPRECVLQFLGQPQILRYCVQCGTEGTKVAKWIPHDIDRNLWAGVHANNYSRFHGGLNIGRSIHS